MKDKKNFAKLAVFAVGASVLAVFAKLIEKAQNKNEKKILYPAYKVVLESEHPDLGSAVDAYILYAWEIKEFKDFLKMREHIDQGYGMDRIMLDLDFDKDYIEKLERKFYRIPQIVEELLTNKFVYPKYQLKYDMVQMVRTYQKTQSYAECADALNTTAELVRSRIRLIRELKFSQYFIHNYITPSQTYDVKTE